MGLGFELSFALAKQALYFLSHASSPFFSGYFGDGVFLTICLGWPGFFILLISASQVARITSMSHQCPAQKKFFKRGNRPDTCYHLGEP
jgi:hypothetical protein